MMEEVQQTPMAQPKVQGVLGTLWLVAKKTGLDMQSFPIDADTVTIGRDWDSDIRLYFSDVSKLHCEIKFDLNTGDASIHVHGSHGIKHAPQGGELSTYKPPSIIPLSNDDTFIVRKKLFRFEYGHEDALIDTPPMQTVPLPSDSPIKASPAQPRRKRVSRRMSLVPSGKNFEPFASPVKSRRHSVIGLGEGPQVIRTPKKSGLASQIEEDEEEEEHVVIEAVDGEEGDVLYVESREEEGEFKPVHNNPFMTPQQKRKAPMRNTSAVPRTRVMQNDSASRGEIHRQEEANGSASPHTPRSVPLPPTADTPYGSVESTPVPDVKTPRSVPLPPADTTPYQVTAQVAMSTPRGPVSLHKALLLRSARKAWQSSQAQNVEGAIVNGDITIKRKSLSPKAQARRSLSHAPLEEDEESEEEEDEDEDHEEGQLQWVYEDGRTAVPMDESDSSIDSLEADQSVDIPGQGVISFGDMSAAEAEEHAMNESFESEEECVQEDDNEDFAEGEGDFEVEEDDEAQDEEVDELESMEEESGPVVEVVAASSTPRRPLERFYTPQPQRTMVEGPRRSLASIGGPPTRLVRMPETPVGASRRVPATPGSLGPPSRKFVPPVDDDDEDEEEVDQAPSTPVKREVNAALLAEAKRRRETLGTPRALPVLPPSFKTPVREATLRAARTPSHPALAPTTPDVELGSDARPTVPMTPIEKVQKELNILRQQSVQRSQSRSDPNRRATVSFALPSTPARPQPKASSSYTVVGTQRPASFAMTMEEDEEVSESGSPVMGGRLGEAVTSLVDDQVEEEVDEDEVMDEEADLEGPAYHEEEEQRPPRTAPATPSFAGMREMFRTAPVAPKTPSFTGIRSMFAESSSSAATPRFGGMKEMFHQPEQPATPHMNGMKTMFALPQEQSTPAMEGLKEMYELEEVEQEAVLEVDTESEDELYLEGDSDVIIISPPKARTATKKSSTSAPAASQGKASAASAKAKAAPSKVPVSSSSAKPKASASAAPSAVVAEKKAAPAAKKIPAPRARAPIAKADVGSKSATKAETATKKVASKVPYTRPRPGDIDDMSMSEIEEPLEYREPVKSRATKAEVSKAATSKVAVGRTKKAETVKAPAKTASTSTATSRAKKAVLGENEDQHEPPVPAPAPAPAKATRAKKAVVEKEKPSSATAAKASSTSATSSRAKSATAEKENEPEAKAPAKKAPVKRAAKKVVEAAVVEPITTRTTRSRK